MIATKVRSLTKEQRSMAANDPDLGKLIRASGPCLLMCRFSDAGMTKLSRRTDGRRPKSAKARNRGRWGTDGAAGAMGILPRARA
jgi:hypothetical protein